MFREVYWMFVVIELEGVYDVNRRHLLFYSALECRGREPIALLFKINHLVVCLKTQCFYPPIP